MRVFEHPNLHNFKCPICGESFDEPVVLVGIDGTEEGFNMQAQQVHVGCIELRVANSREEEGVVKSKIMYMCYEVK